MKSPLPFALGSAAGLALGACNPSTPVAPAANQVADLPANVVADAVEPGPPPVPRRDREPEPARASPDEEPRMQPDPNTPPAKPPSVSPRRVLLPSPTQPPAEIDPVLPEPGDKVPQ